MSGKTEPTRKLDSRVIHTRDALGDALLALMQEKSFESITVQEILDRAGIGRSTFYSHYSDKDDLFLSDMEDFLEKISTLLLQSKERSNRILPAREFFAHVAEMRHVHALLIAADKHRDFLELSHGYFSRAIELRLAELPQTAALERRPQSCISAGLRGCIPIAVVVVAQPGNTGLRLPRWTTSFTRCSGLEFTQKLARPTRSSK